MYESRVLAHELKDDPAKFEDLFIISFDKNKVTLLGIFKKTCQRYHQQLLPHNFLWSGQWFASNSICYRDSSKAVIYDH